MTAEERLLLHGQEHVLKRLDGLSAEEREELTVRLAAIDWEELEQWKRPLSSLERGQISPIAGLKAQEIAARREEFFRVGAEAIRAGKVAAVLLAGGQGTRLGSPAPKGMFDIGLTRPRYIFEQLISNLLSVVKETGAYVPLYIMTSEKNDGETRAFFEEHDFFGYPAEEIKFFVQDMAPSVDFEGKLLFEGRGRLALSPNGNGGWYSSMQRAGLAADMARRGVEWINVFAVDNVLQRIADPIFVGATILSGLMSGAKVVRKCDPHERVGVLCLEDGLPSVVEYYELTEEMANARLEDGTLAYSFGVILNYLFNAKRLGEIAAEKIPVHVVKKKVPYMSEGGELISPQTENGYKFETLILDMVRLMGSCLPFEVEREREFAPVKNRTGVDSVDTARELLQKNGVEL